MTKRIAKAEVSQSVQTDPHEKALGEESLARLEEFAKAQGLDMNEALRRLIEDETRQLRPPVLPCQPLTPKQQEVLEDLKCGRSVKEIAERLGVSEQTIRTHILRARARLGCSDLLSLRYQ
jgi:DNA-binding NarL/FixJ family response regulator